MQKGTTSTTDWTTALAGEILIFHLLGKAFYLEPEREWIQTLIDDQVFAEVPFGAEQEETRSGLEILQRWSQEYKDGITEQHFADIKFDYARLLVGLDVILAAPWESVYFNEGHLVFQEQTHQVREWYRRFDLATEKIGKEPDDHIGLEMMFIAQLANLALQALEKNDSGAFDSTLQAQRDFLTQHLLRWGPAWCKLVKGHAHTDYYRGLAHLTHGALLGIAEVLQVQMPAEVKV
jgi:TorA maturation chaperone TorD